MNKKTIIALFAISLGLAGICLVGIYGNWPTASGMFLMLFGNNLERSSR